MAAKGSQQPASLFDRALLLPALGDSLRKLHPRDVARNPVMAVVWAGSLLTTLFVVKDALDPASATVPLAFSVAVTLWLWFTVLFANFAEAVAEGRGKAQAGALRKMRQDTPARRLVDGHEERVSAPSLRKDDRVVCEAGDLIPGDGEVVEGIASVDESAITGESAPVEAAAGDQVVGGTVALHGLLAGGRIADRTVRDPQTVAWREIARAVRDDEGLVSAVLPIGDGLLVATKRG